MNILVVNPDLPVFPGWGGMEFLNTTALARQAKHVGLVSAIHTAEQAARLDDLRAAGVRLYPWESPALTSPAPPRGPARIGDPRRLGRIALRAARALRLPALGRPADTRTRDFQFRNLAPQIELALAERSWQVLVIIQSCCAHWLDYLPPFPVTALVMHDARARLYAREARTAQSPARRCWAAIEAARYRRFEGYYARRFDQIIAVSDADGEWLRRHYRPQRLSVLPIPVDRQYFTPTPGVAVADNRIVFTGMMNHPPNVDAAVFFARDIFPLIRRRIPEAEFRIVGRDPAPPVSALAALPGVTVTGWVPDIRPEITAAAVVVVPIRFGAGMRQKILEAWAMRKCVVSTTVGAEGIHYTDGQNIRIADDPASMAAAVMEYLRSPPAAAAIQTGGYEILKAGHDPEQIGRRYFALLQETLAQRQTRRGPLRAAIDLRWMYPGVAGGIENLARSFLHCLLRINQDNHYTIIVPRVARHDFAMPMQPGFTVDSRDHPACRARSGWLRLARQVHECLRLDYWRSPEVERLRSAARLGAEVALAVPGYIHPELRGLRNIVIMTDLQHEYHPAFFTDQTIAERRRIYADAVRDADHVCAISEFTRQSIIQHMQVAPGKVSTVHLAADPAFHPGSPCRGHAAAVLASLGLAGAPYLFFPGHTWPHKNHQAAIHALRILDNRHGYRPLLVCTGSHKQAHAQLLRLAAELRVADRVRFLGYRPATELPALYEGAIALVFPSLFEGFGLPLVEAMWCGCPIVCSHATSLPEIAGDAALLINPNDPEDLAGALWRLRQSRELRDELVRRGLERARCFSWEKFTRTIVARLQTARDRRWGLAEDTDVH